LKPSNSYLNICGDRCNVDFTGFESWIEIEYALDFVSKAHRGIVKQGHFGHGPGSPGSPGLLAPQSRCSLSQGGDSGPVARLHSGGRGQP